MRYAAGAFNDKASPSAFAVAEAGHRASPQRDCRAALEHAFPRMATGMSEGIADLR